MDLTLLATCCMLALCVKDVDGLVARLVPETNGTVTTKGRLELLHNGTWSTVCDDRFGKTEAEVACRMLGFNTVRSLAVRSSMYGKGSGSILLDDVRCQGSETSLDQCQHRGLYIHNCTHDEDIGIICIDQPIQVSLTGSELQVRDMGLVQIRLESEWFTVLVPDDKFAKVVCRQLGLPRKEAVVMQASLFASNESRELMVHFACKGHETNILDCDQLTDSASCMTTTYGVICSDYVQMNATLVNGTSPYTGVLQVSHNNSNYGVCSIFYFERLAAVACRTLGHKRANAVAVHPSMYGGSEGVQYMEILCRGNENRLTTCEHQIVNCDCTTDAHIGLICSNHSERLRLTGTSRTRHDMGRVEIQLADEWYSLCLHESAASVVCRKLKQPSTEAVPLWESPGQRESKKLLTKFYCTGNEVNILGCYQKATKEQCSSELNFFGVYCSNSSSLLIHPDGVSYPFMEGTKVTLKCGYRNWTLYNVRWRQNARIVAYGSKLIIYNVTRAHNGILVKCEAMSRAGNLESKLLTSDTLSLQVYYKPIIRITSNLTTCRPQPPLHVCVVTANTSVTIVCNADSNPPPGNISWSGPVSSDTQVLHLTPANSSTHQGVYTCSVVTDSPDEDKRLPLSSSYIFTLIIQDRPTILSFQVNGEDNETVTVSENSDIKMSCLASGRPNMIIFKELNKQEPQRRFQHEIKPIEKEQSDLNYQIQKVECQQSGDYRCEVNNELGNDSQTVRLLVLCSPKLDYVYKIPKVHINNSKGHLSFNMTSYPTPFVSNVTFETADGKVRPRTSLLNNTLNVTCMSKPLAPASVTCDLNVANVTFADMGLYTMVFSNSLGNTPVIIRLIGERGIEVETKSTLREVLQRNQSDLILTSEGALLEANVRQEGSHHFFVCFTATRKIFLQKE